MTDKIPDPDFKPEDADKLINDFAVPLDLQRRKELTGKLEAVRARYTANNKNRNQERESDNSR